MRPTFGPGWRYQIPRVSPFIWHLLAIHNNHFKRIQVAPWNRRRRPKRARDK